jgi:uncharacterized protein
MPRLPHDPLNDADFMATRRRVLAFSVLGVLLTVIVLGLLKPEGMGRARHVATEVLPGLGHRLTAYSLGWKHAPLLFVAGLLSGMLAGMTGMGGGVLKVAFMLLLLRFDFYFARAVALVTLFLASASALWGFVKSGLLVWPVASRMLVLAVPASLLAALLGNRIPPATLTMIFGVFSLFLAFNTVAFMVGDPDERVMTYRRSLPLGDRERYQSALLGGLHGTICGLFGISGGVIATPMQQLLLRMPLRSAIANTLLVSTVVTLLAGIVVVWTGIAGRQFAAHDVVFVDLCMGAGATVGAPIGHRIGQYCTVNGLRALLAVLTAGAGLSIMW